MGFTILGLLPAKKNKIADSLAELICRDIISFNEIEEKVTHPDNFQKIMPQVDAHIDNFLKVKLPQSMPMIAMFVGDKTTAQLKSVFLAELELLFPQIMNGYIDKLREDTDIRKTISEKILTFPNNKIEWLIKSALKPEFQKIKIIGAITGFLIGLIQLLMSLLVSRAGAI